MLTQKNTKAEILAAYEALAAQYAADQAQAVIPTVTWEAIVNTARIAWAELKLLVRDTYRLGAFCRKGFDKVRSSMV